MPVRRAREEDRERWLELRAALLPDVSLAAHDTAIGRALAGGVRRAAFVHEEAPGARLRGVVEVSRDTEPGGRARVETLYVAPDARRRGIGRALVEAAGQWAARSGAGELHCDWRVADAEAHAGLRALGFAETDRRVHFQVKLHPPLALGAAGAGQEPLRAPREPLPASAATAPDRRWLHALLIVAGVACMLATDVFSGDLLRGGLLPLVDLLFVIYLIALVIGRQYRRRTDAAERSVRLFDAAPPRPDRERAE